MNLMLACTNENTSISVPKLRNRNAYLPYGHAHGLERHSGHNGELYEAALSTYALGNGYRFYSPVLARFYSVDSYSPFTILNGYGFCGGDPINWQDPSGHIPVSAFAIAAAKAKARRRLAIFKIKTKAVDKKFISGAKLKLEENIRSRAINLIHSYLGRSLPEIRSYNVEKFLYTATSPNLKFNNQDHLARLAYNFKDSIDLIKSDPIFRSEYMDPLKKIYLNRRDLRSSDNFAFDVYTGRPAIITAEWKRFLFGDAPERGQ